MKKINWDKSKAYLFQALLLVLIGFIGWFGVGFLQGKIQATKDRIQELSVMADYQRKQASRLPELEEQFNFIREHENEFNILLSKDNLVDFIRTLENLAEESDVEIKIASRDNTVLESKSSATAAVKSETVKPADPAEAPAKKGKKESGIITEASFPEFIRLSITVTGTYPQTIVFLRKMETLPVALDVIGFKVLEHPEERGGSLSQGSDVSPFNPTGGSEGQAPVAVRRNLVVDADFDTIVYIKK